MVLETKASMVEAIDLRTSGHITKLPKVKSVNYKNGETTPRP